MDAYTLRNANPTSIDRMLVRIDKVSTALREVTTFDDFVRQVKSLWQGVYVQYAGLCEEGEPEVEHLQRLIGELTFRMATVMTEAEWLEAQERDDEEGEDGKTYADYLSWTNRFNRAKVRASANDLLRFLSLLSLTLRDAKQPAMAELQQLGDYDG